MEIYITNTSALINQVGASQLYNSLPDFRQKAADSCKTPKDKERSLSASALLLFCMKKTGVSLTETPCYNENGKMYFPCEDRFYVNLSHSGDYAACAFDSREIGIDIEKTRQYKENTARRICTMEEMQAFQAIKKEEEKNSAFTRLWTRKESAVKLSGEGVAGLLQFQNFPKDNIYTKTYTPVQGYFLSVSSREDDFPDEVILLSPEFPGQ